MLLERVLLGVLLLSPIVSAQSVENYVSALRSASLDPEQCYRVRDVFLEKEDVKFYFTDGLLIFAEPIEGRDIGAFFIAQKDTDSAEILTLPSSAQERYSLNSFTGEGVLNRRFNHTALLFSDDTADILRDAMAERATGAPDVTQGEVLSRRWSPVFRNLLEHASLRLASDLLSDMPREDGFFAASIGGSGARFDVIVEPRGERDQVSIGQSVRKNGAVFEEIWSRFPGRTFRTGERQTVGFGGRIVDYDLEVDMAEDLSVSVHATALLEIDEAGRRAFPFNLSRSLIVNEILVGGEPAEFLQETNEMAIPGDRDFGTVLLVLADAPAAGETLEIEFRYNGSVVEHADNDVYLVGSRTSWYPRGRFEPSNYRLTFRYPAALDLRATGTLVETAETESRKTSVFHTERPIQLAGFNLGRYLSEVRNVEGYRVEVLANRGLESRFQPPTNYAAPLPPPSGAPRRRGPSPPTPQVLIAAPTELASQPTEHLETVADEVAGSFRYFLGEFGAPIAKTISVTPIPDGYGQGFPGLVYAPTLSYLDVTKPPLSTMTGAQQAFYKEVLFPHEISHQWWGNLVATSDSSDSWLVEALATYSALLYLEQSQGRDGADRILGYYREDLQRRNADGKVVESAGPLVLGDRLTSSRFPNALAIIVYGKGAWVMHMLRNELGDEPFRELLRSLPREFSDRPIDTESFRQAASAYMPEDSADPSLEVFFDQWIYGAGIPGLDVDWSQADGKVSGVIHQSGVSDYFAAPLTLEFQTAAGPMRRQMRTDGLQTEFSFSVDGVVESVALDPDNVLLTVIDRPE